MKDLNWKKGDFEVRTVRDGYNEPHTELVKWNEEASGRRWCYVVAYFHKDSDGYVSLHFVGDRPFRDIAEMDISEIWKELFLSQLMLQDGGKDD